MFLVKCSRWGKHSKDTL